MNGLPPYAIVLLAVLALGMAVLLIVWLFRYVTGSQRQAAAEEGFSSSPASTPDLASRLDQEHVLCVSRKADGGATVTVQGKPYDRLRDIKDPTVGRYAVDAVKGVLIFAEDLLPSTVRRSLRSSKSPMGDAGEGPAQAGLAGEQAQVAPRQLVDQIDQLVQARLRDRPKLAELGIRLREGGGGGLVIFVGQQSYDSVDKVAHEEVRDLIREAIAEWESR
jgi:hypothetical protein